MEITILGVAPVVLHSAAAAAAPSASGLLGAAAATSASAATYTRLGSLPNTSAVNAKGNEVETTPPFAPCASRRHEDEGCIELNDAALSLPSTPPAPQEPWVQLSFGSGTTSPISRSLLHSRYGSLSDLFTFDHAVQSGIDIPALIKRLNADCVTGQVAAWGWEVAVQLAASTRAAPLALVSSLWSATEASLPYCTSEDLVDMAQAWLMLLRRWPRSFRLPCGTLERMTNIAFPSAIKRMTDARLGLLTRVVKDIATHRVDPALSSLTANRQSSARDLVQPIFALIASEVAWRGAANMEELSMGTVELVLDASTAWRWSAVAHVDRGALIKMKDATRAALAEIRALRV